MFTCVPHSSLVNGQDDHGSTLLFLWRLSTRYITGFYVKRAEVHLFTMKAISAFSRYFSFSDHHRHKTHESSRWQTDSIGSTRPAYMDQPPQQILAGGIDSNKLIQLLNSKFGSHYVLDVRRVLSRVFIYAKC